MVPPEDPLALSVLKELKLSPESRIVMAVFPFRRDNAPAGPPGNIAPFARQNHYKELIILMKKLIRTAPFPLSGLTKRQYRLFSNSTLPEKELAAGAGLGFPGKNSLLITPGHGSRCLIAGMILPAEIALSRKERPPGPAQNGCGSCRICEKACPGNAISAEGFLRDNCLQSWTTDPRPVPEKLKACWGNRIYGCTICQDVCPFNKNVPMGRQIDKGPLPGSVSLEFLLSAEDEEINTFKKGTTLGMSWVTPALLRRNAALSAAHEKNSDLLPLLEKILLRETDKSLRDACSWAIERLTGDREL